MYVSVKTSVTRVFLDSETGMGNCSEGETGVFQLLLMRRLQDRCLIVIKVL